MDIAHRLHGLQSQFGLSRRIRSLSKRIAGTPVASFLARERRRLAGAGLLVFSLCTGVWAKDLAQTTSLQRWLRDHPPSDRIWKHALESRGYVLLADDRSYRRAARTLPSLADEPSAVWISSDGRWVAIYRRGEERMDALLYCLRCDDPAKNWEPLGKGWQAFEAILVRADQAVAGLVRPTARQNRAYVDPMELRY